MEISLVDVTSIEVREDVDGIVARAYISMPEQEGEAWYRMPVNSGTDLEAATDAFFLIGLILAMGSDGVLRMDQPVSKRLIYSQRAVQEILLHWHSQRLDRAKIRVPSRRADSTPTLDRTVTCFTGGVDSFDTLINNPDADALLYVHGFDISLSKTEIRETTSSHLHAVAKETGRELIEVETNIRDFLDNAGSWPLITHGPALASVGHLLSGRFKRILLPSSHTYADQYPWGSDPLIDHLWSSDRLTVVHDGAGSTRVQKIMNLADDPSAQQHLRVCWQNTGKYNCGECDKCLRTMITLSLAGALPVFETFESELSLDTVRTMKVTTKGKRAFAVANLRFAEERGVTEMAEVLTDLVNAYDARVVRRILSGKEKTPVTVEVAALREKLSAKTASNASLKRRLARSESRVRKLESLLPVRLWGRFARWRRRKWALK